MEVRERNVGCLWFQDGNGGRMGQITQPTKRPGMTDAMPHSASRPKKVIGGGQDILCVCMGIQSHRFKLTRRLKLLQLRAGLAFLQTAKQITFKRAKLFSGPLFIMSRRDESVMGRIRDIHIKLDFWGSEQTKHYGGHVAFNMVFEKKQE